MTRTIHSQLQQLGKLISQDVSNVPAVQDIIKSLLDCLMTTQPAESELIFIALSRLPGSYWIDNSTGFDGLVLSQLLMVVCRQPNPKAISSICDMLVCQSYKNFKKYHLCLNDLVGLLMHVIPGVEEESRIGLDLEQVNDNESYLRLWARAGGSQRSFECLLEILIEVLESQPTVHYSTEYMVIGLACDLSKQGYMYTLQGGNVLRLIGAIISPQFTISESDFSILSLSVFKALEYFCSPGIDNVNLTLFLPLLDKIASRIPSFPLSRHTLKPLFNKLYEKVVILKHVELETLLFRIWSNFEISTWEDYVLVERIIFNSPKEDIPERVSMIRDRIHTVTQLDCFLQFLVHFAEKSTELIMSTVESDNSKMLPWCLYILLWPSSITQVQEHYQSFFEFVSNCVPARILDLDATSCIRLLEHIASLCLMAELTGTLVHMDQMTQRRCSYLLCMASMPLENMVVEDDRSWNRAFQHLTGLQLWNQEWKNGLFWKALRALPTTNITFHYNMHIINHLKIHQTPEIWRNAKLVLPALWQKHQSLEMFCKYLSSLSFDNVDFFRIVIDLVGVMNCIESGKYEFKLLLGSRFEMDLYEYVIVCPTCDRHDFNQVNSHHVVQLLSSVFQNSRAENASSLGFKALKRVLSHDTAYCTVDVVQGYALPLSTNTVSILRTLLSPNIPRSILGRNWTLISQHVRDYLDSSCNPRPLLKELGYILKTAPNSPHLFLEIVLLLVDYSCRASHVNRAIATSELLKIQPREYGIVLKEISIWAVQQLDSSPKLLQTICQVLKKSTSEFIELSWPYTLPVLVSSRNQSLLRKVTTKGKDADDAHIVKRLIYYSGDIMAHLLVHGKPEDLKSFLSLLAPGTASEELTVESILKSNQLQLIRNIIVACGDLDPGIKHRAFESLRFIASTLHPKIDFQNGENLGQYLHQYALGVLTKLQAVFVPTTFETSLSLKQCIVRGLNEMVRILGSYISSISNQILGFLQTISDDDTIQKESLCLWKAFVFNLPRESLQGLLVVITLNLLALKRHDEAESKLIEIFEYLVVRNAQYYSSHIRQIADKIPNTDQWRSIKNHALKFLTFRSFQHELVDVVDLISHENNTVVLNALLKLKELLIGKQLEIEKMLLNESIDKLVKGIIQKLCLLVHKYNSSDSDIGLIACECLGVIGAIDPSRIDLTIKVNSMFGPQLDISHFEGALNFVCALVEYYLAPTFKATQDSNHQALLAYTIQNTLEWCGFNREIIKEASKVTTQKMRPTTQSILANRWKKFPKHIVHTIEPLLESRYKMPPVERVQLDYPYFPKCSTYGDWIRDWTLDLLYKIPNETKRNIFRLCEDVMAASDTNVIQILLPHIVHHVIVGNNAKAILDIHKEFLIVLSSSGSSETHQLSLQLIFHLIEFFSKWIRSARIRISQRKVRNVPTANLEALEQELGKVESFLAKIPQDLLSSASIRCNSFARALLHLELHIRENRQQNNNVNLEPMLAQMQKIYAQLGDADSLEGISTQILNPTLEQQIIHHEVCGRWPAAQSCYEVLLQQNPQDTSYQMGLLECLQNMGHYESMITYSKGILATDPSKVKQIAPFSIIASWKLGDWNSLEKIVNLNSDVLDFEASLGKILLALKNKSQESFEKELKEIRKSLMSSVAASSMESYHRAYDSILQLSILHDIEQFQKIVLNGALNDLLHNFQRLKELWQYRLDAMSPSFRAKESVLNLRRILLGVALSHGSPNSKLIEEQKGWLWLQTAKQSRKNGYFQTAYSAILQAKDLVPGLARVEQANWFRSQQQNFQAITEMRIAVGRDLKTFEPIEDKCPVLGAENERKASLRLARWLEETNGMYSAAVLKAFSATYKAHPTWEKAGFILGSYYYRCYVDEKQKCLESDNRGTISYSVANSASLTCKTYGKSLCYGSKYLHQSMPRLITTWLDLGAVVPNENGKGDSEKLKKKIQQNNELMSKLLDHIPKFQFLAAIPQLISRICHPSLDVQELLDRLIVDLLASFHQQTLWHLMSVAKSTIKARVSRVTTIFTKAKTLDSKSRLLNISTKIQISELLTDNLIQLCNFPITPEMVTLSMSAHFRKLQRLVSDRPIDVIIPIQSSMVGSLPLPGTQITTHRPFTSDLPTILSFHDEIQILSSLQKPRKITIEASDGKSYVFLCKADDDLRKDSRLMEVNTIINKLLLKDSESRKRNLNVRTYTVVPLNEKCGIIQWVNNMNGYRNIMLKIYKSKGIYTHHQSLKDMMDKAKTVEEKVRVFTNDIITKHPPVFREWFFEMFPEPTKWIASRKCYTSTLATMSMVGFIVGLGDRHGENILFDENTGDCLHVDLNCLFEKGLEFSVPERVPFRLTHNMVDAFGIYGVEGPFRKSCEAALNVLRTNKDLLMSVLETFLHDPLCEWSKQKSVKINPEGENPIAIRALKTIDKKLRGFAQQSIISLSVAGQVDELISMATDPRNLAQMYIGWAPFL